VVLSIDFPSGCRNKRTGQCSATRGRLRRSPGVAITRDFAQSAVYEKEKDTLLFGSLKSFPMVSTKASN
jgi:hypothetical protein